jgi:hypothetical protein
MQSETFRAKPSQESAAKIDAIVSTQKDFQRSTNFLQSFRNDHFQEFEFCIRRRPIIFGSV